jgi:hypothetical protein
VLEQLGSATAINNATTITFIITGFSSRFALDLALVLRRG